MVPEMTAIVIIAVAMDIAEKETDGRWRNHDGRCWMVVVIIRSAGIVGIVGGGVRLDDGACRE